MRFGQNKSNNMKEDVMMATPEVKEEVKVTQEPLDLLSTAFSLVSGPEGGYSLVVIKFNPVTMAAKVESVKKVSDSRQEGEYFFRVAVGQYFADQESKS